MQQENIYNRQDNKVAAAAATPKRGMTSKEPKAQSEKDAKIIRKFLEGVGPYEADALRIAISLADGKVAIANLSNDDQLAINRYLNYGLARENPNLLQIQSQRIHRATSLSKRAVDFCSKLQLLTVYEALMNLAMNSTYVEQARLGLDKIAAGRSTAQTGLYNFSTNTPK